MKTTKYCPATENPKDETRTLDSETLKGDDIEATTAISTEGNENLVKAIKGNGKTTKETPTTITITTTITTTTTTATETTTITNNKTGGRKLPGPMLQPQPRVEVAAGNNYQSATVMQTHHHNGQCPPKCGKCGRLGHEEKDCRVRCPKGRNPPNKGARARALWVENPQQNPNVVTGTFLLNDHYASILFDSWAEKSFVSSAFTPFIDIAPTALNTSYEVELADGKTCCPNPLGSFDVTLGMDLLGITPSPHRYYEIVPNSSSEWARFLKSLSERQKRILRITCMYHGLIEKQLDDILVVLDFPGEHASLLDLHTGLALQKFRIVKPLKELHEKGFIRPELEQVDYKEPLPSSPEIDDLLTNTRSNSSREKKHEVNPEDDLDLLKKSEVVRLFFKVEVRILVTRSTVLGHVVNRNGLNRKALNPVDSKESGLCVGQSKNESFLILKENYAMLLAKLPSISKPQLMAKQN
ncbi:putative reverse transcriptase domain-containing protein [Tanacetum coccineum]